MLSDVDENASFVTGFGLASPTHPYVPPAVWLGTFVLKGTLRRPGILPRIVAGRSSSRNSFDDVLIDQRRGPRRVGDRAGRDGRLEIQRDFRRRVVPALGILRGIADLAGAFEHAGAGGAHERRARRHVRPHRDLRVGLQVQRRAARPAPASRARASRSPSAPARARASARGRASRVLIERAELVVFLRPAGSASVSPAVGGARA